MPIDNNTIVEVPFRNDTIQATKAEKDWLVSIRRICDNLHIDYGNQLKKLKTKKWAVVVLITTTGADGKTYEMAAIDRRTLTMRLATLDANRVGNPEARAKIEAYQNEAADALDA